MQQTESYASRGHVMVVDDDALFLESVSTNLVDAGYRTQAFSGGAEAIHHLCGRPEGDLLLLDWKMPGITGIVHGEGFLAGDGEIGFRANVRAFIKRIRQKFRDVDPDFARIKNYPGFGYRWVDGRD